MQNKRNYPGLLMAIIIALLSPNKINAGKPGCPAQIKPQSAPGCSVLKNLLNGKDWVFRENKGQLKDEEGKLLDDIKYYGNQGGVYIYCRSTKLSFVFSSIQNGNSKPTTNLTKFGIKHNLSSELKDSKIIVNRVDLTFLNSNPIASIVASGKTDYYENYYTTGDANYGITNISTFKTITYNDVYPNIDLVLFARDKSLKYEFIVHPGGKLEDVKLKWSGLESIAKLENGGILYKFSSGKIAETSPYSYQILDS